MQNRVINMHTHKVVKVFNTMFEATEYANVKNEEYENKIRQKIERVKTAILEQAEEVTKYVCDVEIMAEEVAELTRLIEKRKELEAKLGFHNLPYQSFERNSYPFGFAEII